MKLYTMKGSRYGSRCLIQISAKGLSIPVELLPYPLPDGFEKINPLRLVPVLDLDGEMLPESQVICEYLEDLGQGPSLRPDDARERARMRLVIRLFELYYDPAMLKLYAMLQMNPLTDPPMPKDPVVIASAIDQIKNALNLIAAQLDGGQYCIGGKLSLADCALMPPFLQAKIVCPILGIDDFIAGQETISTYYDATRHDPNVARVLDDIEPYLRLLMNGRGASGADVTTAPPIC